MLPKPREGAECVGARAPATHLDLFAPPMSPLVLPPGYARIRRVQSFQELVSMPFGGGVNALCWERTLSGDFSEVVHRIGGGEGIVTLAP